MIVNLFTTEAEAEVKACLNPDETSSEQDFSTIIDFTDDSADGNSVLEPGNYWLLDND
jgi:hypothetical protein